MTTPAILAWEITRACNLNCVHCRASATEKADHDELTTDQGYELLRDLSKNTTRMVILSGGEPLMRNDVFDLARYGTSLGLRMTLGTNGSLVTDQIAKDIKSSGIVRVSVSLDGTTSDIHDSFRGMAGAFDMALRGIRMLRENNVPVQVNTTVAAMNVFQMDMFPDFIKDLGAVAWHVFFLVPTGRGQGLEPAKIHEYRNMLDGFYRVYKQADIECKATCAPQFYRLLAENGDEVNTKGCLAGTGFGFVSSQGIVQPCGYLQIPCGDIRKTGIEHIWSHSETLQALRNTASLKGKCGECSYTGICGGCRARAYEVLNDFMDTDPICWYNNR